MKKVIISFDVDGTLVKPDYDNFIWFKEIPELYAKKHGIKISLAKKIVKEEYDKVGENDPRWYVPQFWLGRFGLGVREEEILRKYEDKIQIYEDAKAVLPKLYKEYSLIVSSAMPHSFLEIKLKKDNLFQYFKKIFSAVSDFNMVKKDDTFYQKICERLGISPSCIIHVGDNYQADFLVPCKIGIKAFYLKRTNSAAPSSTPFTVRNLLEFASRLESYVEKLNLSKD